MAINRNWLTLFLAIFPLTACSGESDKPGQALTESADAKVALELAAGASRAWAAAPGETSGADVRGALADAEGVMELEWDALIPEQWRPDKLLEQYDASALADDDPRVAELMDKLRKVWTEAPVVPGLDGKRVKLPGFVVPLEGDDDRVSEFLLVPYYGACIHVPPPPANQTVHVVTEEGHGYRGKLFDAVWVTGTLRVQSTSSDLANAGYSIRASRVEPYM